VYQPNYYVRRRNTNQCRKVRTEAARSWLLERCSPKSPGSSVGGSRIAKAAKSTATEIAASGAEGGRPKGCSCRRGGPESSTERVESSSLPERRRRLPKCVRLLAKRGGLLAERGRCSCLTKSRLLTEARSAEGTRRLLRKKGSRLAEIAKSGLRGTSCSEATSEWLRRGTEPGAEHASLRLGGGIACLTAAEIATKTSS